MVTSLQTVIFSDANKQQASFVLSRQRRRHQMMLFSTTEHDDEYMRRDDIKRRRRLRNLDFWGVEMHSAFDNKRNSTTPHFPSTFEDVADHAFEAIAGTICGQQHLDPNVASNAMHTSVLDYRPTHNPYASIKKWSDGEKRTVSKKDLEAPARMGIEIDAASFLLSKEHLDSDIKSTAEGRAMVIFSLELARRLVASPWTGFEEGATDLRPCVVFYNTMDQALIASHELSRLKEKARIADRDILDQIYMSWLGQGSLPIHMEKKRKKEPTNGIVLVVKPTDYDNDSLIPNLGQPTVYADCVEKLQRILFQASAYALHTIVVSPRLTELAPLVQPITPHTYKTGPWGHEQSLFQRAATYGGIEPPVGPTSWLLRDLIPPVYVWIGCALDISGASSLRKRKLSKRSLRSLAKLYRDQQMMIPEEDQHFDDNDAAEYSFYSRLVMTQTSMGSGHTWNIFAVKENASSKDWQSTHQFIGSAMPSRGRPNRGIMKDVFAEWCDKNNDKAT